MFCIFATFVHFTTHEASTHIGFGAVTLLGHNPAATHKDVIRHSLHVLEGVNFPNMVVEIVKLFNHSVMDEIVLEHFSSVLVDVPWLPTVIADVEVTTIFSLELGLLYDILALNNFGKFHEMIA